MLMAAALVGGVFLGLARAEEHGKSAAPAAGAEVGKKAPDFTLKDVDGKEHKLADYKGKVVVLQWTNCDCPFIVRHEKTQQTMQKTYSEFKGKDVAWLAIDSTDPAYQGGHGNDKIKAWASDKDVNLPFPVLRDEDGSVGHAYGAKTTPHVFVINKEGVVVYAGAIDDDPTGNKSTSNNYVSAAVKATLAGSSVETPSTKPYGCGVHYKGGK
jgi:peroxiredoxin